MVCTAAFRMPSCCDIVIDAHATAARCQRAMHQWLLVPTIIDMDQSQAPGFCRARSAGKLGLVLELVRCLDRHDLTTPAGNLVKLLIEGATPPRFLLQ